MTVQTQATSLLTAPIIPSAGSAGQVIGLTLQNPTSVPFAGRMITFGQEFAPGQVPAGGHLIAMINGQPTPVQMEVKTTNPDGSVAMAVLTLAQPPIAAGASVPVMLSLAPAASTAPKPVDITALAAASSNYATCGWLSPCTMPTARAARSRSIAGGERPARCRGA
jgi:hypothetical protein